MKPLTLHPVISQINSQSPLRDVIVQLVKLRRCGEDISEAEAKISRSMKSFAHGVVRTDHIDIPEHPQQSTLAQLGSMLSVHQVKAFANDVVHLMVPEMDKAASFQLKNQGSITARFVLRVMGKFMSEDALLETMTQSCDMSWKEDKPEETPTAQVVYGWAGKSR